MIKKYETIKVLSIQPHVLLIIMNRPHVSNAFNTKMAEEISSFFEDFSLNNIDCRAIILTGMGEKSFSAGADLKERRGMTLESWKMQHSKFEKMIQAILNCETPIIGAINGAAFGGGCELVAALDFSFASETATFAQTEAKLGIIPGIGGTQNLSRAIGEKRAKELILSGRIFTAVDALSWGLINEVFSYDLLLTKTVECAVRISNNAPFAIKQAKKAIHEGLQMTLANGMEYELKCYNRTISTKDREEGILAFNEKRNPNFTGK